MNNLPNKLLYFIVTALVIVVIALSFAVFKLFETTPATVTASPIPVATIFPAPTVTDKVSKIPIDVCGTECKKEIASQVAKAISGIPGTVETQTIIKEVSTPATPAASSTDFISLGSTATTTNTAWENVDDAAVFIDLANDYSANAYVTWEASLKVAHGNGQAFARLWDDTNKIAVAGSEISTVNNADFEQKISGNLPLWRGRNLYKVQIKSLNSFEVTYSGGRIKIVD